MNVKDLEQLYTDEFLDSLECDSETDEVVLLNPDWLPGDKDHYIYRAWEAINTLFSEREATILAYNQIAGSKTPKSIYSIKKSDVGKVVDIKANNIFYGRDRDSDAKEGIRKYFNAKNEVLLKLFEKKQASLLNPQSVTGIRIKKKEEIVDELQKLREENLALKRKHAKDSIDLAIKRLPLDLQQKFSN